MNVIYRYIPIEVVVAAVWIARLMLPLLMWSEILSLSFDSKKLISCWNPLGLRVLALRYQLPVSYHQNNTCGLRASASRAFLLS
jgi:hypothetical protein